MAAHNVPHQQKVTTMRTTTTVITQARRLHARATAYSRASLTAHQRAVWAAQAQQWARHAIALTNVLAKPTKVQRKAAVRRWLAAQGRPVLATTNAAVRVATKQALRAGAATPATPHTYGGAARVLCLHRAALRCSAAWHAGLGIASPRPVALALRLQRAQAARVAAPWPPVAAVVACGWQTVLVNCNLL